MSPIRSILRHPVTATLAVTAVAAGGMLAASSVHALALSTAQIAGGACYRTHNTDNGIVNQSACGTGDGTTGAGGFLSTSSIAGALGPNDAAAALASANLATGGLHGVANAYQSTSWAQIDARFADDVHFSVAGAAPNQHTPIVVTWRLDGTVNTLANLSWGLDFGMSRSGCPTPQSCGAGFRRLTILDDNPGIGSPNDYISWFPATEPGGWVDWQLVSGDYNEFVFRGVIWLYGPESDYHLAASLGMRCTGGTLCNFGNSAHVNFELPDGVSFTSASGHFLTQVPGAGVPEPGAAALAGLGLASVGWLRRRRRG